MKDEQLIKLNIKTLVLNSRLHAIEDILLAKYPELKQDLTDGFMRYMEEGIRDAGDKVGLSINEFLKAKDDIQKMR